MTQFILVDKNNVVNIKQVSSVKYAPGSLEVLFIMANGQHIIETLTTEKAAKKRFKDIKEILLN